MFVCGLKFDDDDQLSLHTRKKKSSKNFDVIRSAPKKKLGLSCVTVDIVRGGRKPADK